MSYIFEGRSFNSLEEWKRAYPAYRSYPEFVKGGAKTIAEMEAHIALRANHHRVATLTGARRSKQINPPPSFARKRKNT